MKPYFIIDNFFENPGEIREFALNQIFYEPKNHPYTSPGMVNFPGVRTNYINELNYNLWEIIFDKILFSIYDLTEKNINPDHYNHWNWSSFSQTFDDVNKNLPLWHRDFDDDGCLYFVGVCYLNINPLQNTGTIIQDLNGHQHIIENKFNRFLIYSNHLFHSCQGSFGKDKNDARMVLTHATKFELKNDICS